MAEALTTLARLLVVLEVQEDEAGATFRFQQGEQGRLALADANYGTHLRLARRSQERQHPVGVGIGHGNVITEMIRADNDVPLELWDDGLDDTRVIFQGHDGVFRVKSSQPESPHIRKFLGEALRQKTRVWFIAQKPDLFLLDVLPTEKPA
jgi:hypothetical protein